MKYGALESPYHEANEFLSKYVVGKDDPSNKLGKAHVRPLRDDEELPKGISHKAMSDTSGILGVNDRNVYWTLGENGDISFPELDEEERENELYEARRLFGYPPKYNDPKDVPWWEDPSRNRGL